MFRPKRKKTIFYIAHEIETPFSLSLGKVFLPTKR